MIRYVSVLSCVVLLSLCLPALPAWPPAQRITTGPNDNLHPALSYFEGTRAESPRLVWQRSRTNGWDIYYSTNPMGTAWTTPQALASLADSNLTPAVAGFDPRWVCAWVNVHGGIQDIFFSRWQSGAWTVPLAISTDGFDDAEPAVWIAQLHDSIWVAWSSFRSGRWSVISRVYNGSSWSPEIPVVTSPGNNRAPRFFMYAKTQLPGLVWQGDSNGNWDIYLSQFQGGIWTPPRPVTSGPQADLSPAPATLYRFSSALQHTDLVWATDTIGNFEIFATLVDSPGVRERITSSDFLDTEPAALNHLLPAAQAMVYPPILTAWTSRRQGNPNIYAQLFSTQDVVDTNRANDNHPAVTCFNRGGYFHEWVVWQSDRDGNWNLYGSYQMRASGVEEEGKDASFLSQGRMLRPSPFRPPGRLTLFYPGSRSDISFRFYDLQGRIVGLRSRAEKKAPGQYELTWDGRDASGKLLPSGLYFLKPEGTSALFRIILLR